LLEYINGVKKMIVNNVMLKLKNRDDDNISNVKAELLSMKGNIDVLNDIVVASNINKEDPNFDIFFSTKFESVQDYQTYLVHPLHIKVSKNIGSNIESTASILCGLEE
jgi:hypothetical protein